MDNNYLTEIREARNKTAVLKTQVLKIRSSKTKTPIIIFEGKTDIGPYETWIKRINPSLEYISIPSNGKKHSLEFYEKLEKENQDWKNYIYFIVDRDFDELRGYKKSEIIFHTCHYSMENYLISTEALQSILNDEFECAGEHEIVQKILETYKVILNSVCSALIDANKRIYLAQNNSLVCEGKVEKINKYLEITLSEVTRKHNDQDLKVLIPLQREPTTEELDEIDQVFSTFDKPETRFRGKYLFNFFKGWISVLAEDRRSAGTLFKGQFKKINFHERELTHRSLASRVAGPDKLNLFIEKICNDAIA